MKDTKIANATLKGSTMLEPEFLNKYECPDCGYEWHDIWSCGCDEECPICGARDISPVTSTELTGDGTPD